MNSYCKFDILSYVRLILGISVRRILLQDNNTKDKNKNHSDYYFMNTKYVINYGSMYELVVNINRGIKKRSGE